MLEVHLKLKQPILQHIIDLALFEILHHSLSEMKQIILNPK